MLGFYTREDIPDHHRLTDEYVLFDPFFQALSGGSTCNALYRVAPPPRGADLSQHRRAAERRGRVLGLVQRGLGRGEAAALKRALGRDSGSAVVDSNTLYVPHHNAFPYCPS